MKIATTGIRGIPADYGAFENFAEEREVSINLCSKGR